MDPSTQSRRWDGLWIGALALCGSALSCRKPSPPKLLALSDVATRSASPVSPPAPTGSALPPLRDVTWLEPLPLADGNLAYVMPPIGAREPRPLVVAVHGAGDRPDWACGGWRLGASEYPFVVCPQGLKMDPLRFAWDFPVTIQRRVRAAIDAAHARFGAYIADGPVIYAGFSQGATMAGPVLLETPGRFPVVALAEGGYDLLRDPGFLKKLEDQGTNRLMIVCGSPACFLTAKSIQPSLIKVGIQGFTAGDPLSGHNLNQRMQDSLHVAFPLLTAGMPNWAGFPEYLAARARDAGLTERR